MAYAGPTNVEQMLHWTRSKIYRCDSDKAAMVAHDLVTSKCQTKVKYEWNNGYIFKCSDIEIFEYLSVVQIFKYPNI